MFSFFSGLPPHEMKAPPLRNAKPQAMFGQTPKAIGGAPAPVLCETQPNLQKPSLKKQVDFWA